MNAICRAGLLVFALIVLAFAVSAGNIGSFSISTVVGVPYEFQINLTNTVGYDLHNVQLVGDRVSSGVVDVIPVNSTVPVSVVYTSDSLGSFSDVLRFVGFKSVPCGEVSQGVPLQVNISAGGSFPADLKVCVGESVRFQNNYDSWIKLRFLPEESSWGDQIGSGSSFVRSFSNVGVVSVDVYPLISGSEIAVGNDDRFVHSGLDDLFVSLSVESSYADAQVLLEGLSEDSFEVSYDGSADGYFVVRNTGSEEALGVSFGGDWLVFDSSGFDLGGGESRAVNFVVSPVVTSSEATNLTYVVRLGFSCLNCEPGGVNLSVFVPFASELGYNLTSAGFWRAKQEFCEGFPSSPLCASAPQIVYRDVPMFACPDVLVNMSAEDVQLFLRESLSAQDTSLRAFELVKQYLDAQSDHNGNVSFWLNESNAVALRNAEEIESLRGNNFFLLFSLLAVAGLCVAGWALWRFYGRRKQESVYG